MHARSLALVATATLVTAASACSGYDTVTPDQCNIKIVTVTPDDPSLVIAHTLPLHAAYTTGISPACVPTVPASSLIWVSTNPAVLSVDSITGVVTGHNTGAISVTLHLPGSTSSIGSVTVTITAE
jgi:uncharacterized protein YjdB